MLLKQINKNYYENVTLKLRKTKYNCANEIIQF